MKRHSDWLTRFHGYLEGRASVPFSWGSQDCSMFAADGVLAITGEDIGAPYRGYDTALGAARILDENGDCQGLATLALGEPIAWAYARRGDMVLHMVDDRQALGLCAGDVFAAPGPDGLVYRPMHECLMAWSV